MHAKIQDAHHGYQLAKTPNQAISIASSIKFARVLSLYVRDTCICIHVYVCV